MPKFEANSRIRTRLVTIWIFPDICFGFRSAGETQLTTEKCMEKFKLWLDAFVYGYMPQILAFSSSLPTLKFSIYNFFKTKVLLKIYDAELPYKLSYFEPLCLLAKMAAKTVTRSMVVKDRTVSVKRGWQSMRVCHSGHRKVSVVRINGCPY